MRSRQPRSVHAVVVLTAIVLSACVALGRPASAAASAEPSSSTPAPALSPSPAPSEGQNFAVDIATAVDLRRKGRMREALELLAADHKTAPANRDVTVAYAETASYAGDQGKAIGLLDGLLATTPDDVDARIVLARAYAYNHDYAAAEAQYQRCLATAPADADAQVGLAQTYAFEGRFDDAKRLYQTVLAHDPKNYDALVGLAGAEGFAGDYRRARADYRTVLAAQPDNTDAMIGLATVDYWLGDIPSSISLDNQVLALDPADSDARDLRRQLNIKLSPQLISTMTTTHSSDGSTFDYRLAERFFASPTLAFGVLEELYRLSGNGATAQTHRFGINATYQQSAAFGIDLRVLGSKYAGVPEVTDSVFSMSGTDNGAIYGIGVSTGGVDGSVSANGGQTSPGQTSSLVRINTLFGNLGYTRRKTTVGYSMQSASYNDGNRYHEIQLDVSHEFALNAREWLTPQVSIRHAGFSDTYDTLAQALAPGYYDFASQRDIVLSATATRQLSDHLSLGALGSLGFRRTAVPVYPPCQPYSPTCPGPYAQSPGTLPFQRLEPYFDYEGDRYSLAGAFYDDHFAGGPGVGAYAASTIDVTFSIRLP